MENFIFCAVYVLKKHGENVDNPSVKIYVKKKKKNRIIFKIETGNNKITWKHWKESNYR